MQRASLKTLIAAITVIPFVLPPSSLRAGNIWDGGGGDNLWSNSLNWNGDTLPAYGTLVFDGALQTTNVIDTVVNMNQVNWNGAMPWVLNSSGPGHLMLYDNGGTQAKLENFGTVAVTINAPITFAATAGANFGEINAVTGSMNFTGSTLTVNGSAVNGIKFWGGNGNDVSFANTVNASGKWFGFTSTNSQSVTIASGANVMTGDWYVMNGGTLKLAGGTLTTSAVRLGGDFGTTGNQNQALGGTLALTSPTGGINFSGPINAVGGNTSNALLISSQNATGTNTLTGGIFLDSDLKIQQMPGAALTTSTGTFDVKARKLSVEAGAASTVTISQALTSSLAAGGSLVKEGNGTLVLSSTSNNYTGTSTGSLNANGTQIVAGTLAIAGDGSLGLVPSSAYNNVQFTGSGTLRADATMTLNANRGVSIAGGAAATFDNNGNSFRINGIIDGTGNAVISGGGTTILAANNTYSGTTTISPGSTLQIGAGSSSGRPGNGSGAIINDGALVVNRTGTYNIANSISGSGSFTKISSGQTAFTGTVSYTGTTTISAGILLVGHSLGGGDIINNAGLIFAHNSAVSVPNNISGSGTVELGGSGGTTIFTGTNTYTGLTTIGGVGTLTLQVGNGGTTGTLGTAGVTGGTGKNIIFNRSDSIIVPNVISVGGSLTQAGAGTIVLTGPNTYSGGTVISAGILQIGNGGTAGVLGTGAVTNNASLVFNRS
ncbi:MAG: autotransporter-associated beta strand repeat-containing protein, partial [Verrucomicrobiaceae bacterium]|nr:autotransporter-associated beta strand repeat-containing protein [Verrucomicrobiaceae bacterium]